MSEFLAACDLQLNTLEGKPSPNIEGSKEVIVKKGDKIPDIFIPDFLKKNRDLISNLKIEDGIPVLTKEQETKYKVKFEKSKPTTFKEEVEKNYPKWDLENLTQKLADKGSKEFKDWAEKEFGEDFIDRRKASRAIIVQILDRQDKELK